MKHESAIENISSAFLVLHLPSLSNIWLIAASGTQRGNTLVCHLRPRSGSSTSFSFSTVASKQVAATMGDSPKPLRYVDVCLASNPQISDLDIRYIRSASTSATPCSQEAIMGSKRMKPILTTSSSAPRTLAVRSLW